MKFEDVVLDEDLKTLWLQLHALRSKLRDHTMATYHRVNPFTEDLFEWKEKGGFCGGKDVTIYDSTTVNGNVTIGDHTWVGPFCALDGTGGLSIGCYCTISAGTYILTHDTVKWALSGGRAPYEYSSVSIGNCCFIGTNVVITRGVTIGDHCVVGAGAIVIRNIPAYSVVAGVPARLIGHVEVEGDKVEICINKIQTSS